MDNFEIIPVARGRATISGFAPLIDHLGQEEFAQQLAQLLREICGSVFLAILQTRADATTLIGVVGLESPQIALRHAERYVYGMHWRHDPARAAADIRCRSDATILVRVDPRAIADSILRDEFYRPANIVDKLAVCARRGDTFFSLNMMHSASSGRFDSSAVRRVGETADFMIAAIAKHAALCNTRARENPLASLNQIHQSLSSTGWGLSPREREVCARILYGIASPGIANDLGIREQSVATYRKRAYSRLGIGTRHELLRKYLTFYSASPHQPH